MIAMFLAASASLGFSQQTAPASQQTAAGPAPAATGSEPAVTLDQAVAAAMVSAPGLTVARVALDTARSQLTEVQATNGLSLAARGGYSHQGDLTGGSAATGADASAAAAASGSGVRGDTVQGGLDLSGPSTSVGLTAQHSITPAPSDQVSGLSLSASQTVFDGYAGGRASALVQQAQDTYRIAQVAFDAAQKGVTYQVKQAYYTLLTDQETLQVRQVTVQQAQENLAYYQGLLQAGRVTSLEVLLVQVT
ncbi:MAG TPA: TolC family protein, partial [Spirochaetia bacterium]|nr:TolC family protein [Spirochaetia bacterium]